MTSRSLEYFDLGERGLAYVRTQLAHAKTLGALIIGSVDQGEAFTCAPTGTSLDQIYAFEAGGLLPENLDMSRAVQVEGGGMMAVVSLLDERLDLIRGAMQATAGGICIADDVNPTWQEHRERVDAWAREIADDVNPTWREHFERMEATAFGVDNEVYHLADAGASLDAIEDAFVGLLPWHGITVICQGPLAISDARECDPAELKRAALSATLITCSAYDGEGFVAWRKKG